MRGLVRLMTRNSRSSLARVAGFMSRAVGHGFAVAVAAVVLVCAVAPNFAVSAQSGSYQGTVVGDASATVSFQVETGKSGKRKRAVFQAAKVQVFCDDGLAQRETFLPIHLRFRNGKVFRGEDYFIEPGTIYQTYYEVSGRLLSGGRARGTIVFISNVFDPPGTAPAPNPDCSTGQEVAWTAQRAG